MSNKNDCTMEVIEVSDNMFDSNEIGYLLSNISEVKPSHRCDLCCSDVRTVLNPVFNSVGITDMLSCDACFSLTPRVEIPSVFLSHYIKVRSNLGIMGIN